MVARGAAFGAGACPAKSCGRDHDRRWPAVLSGLPGARRAPAGGVRPLLHPALPRRRAGRDDLGPADGRGPGPAGPADGPGVAQDVPPREAVSSTEGGSLPVSSRYWPLSPSKAVTVWLAIDDADRDN